MSLTTKQLINTLNKLVEHYPDIIDQPIKITTHSLNINENTTIIKNVWISQNLKGDSYLTFDISN